MGGKERQLLVRVGREDKGTKVWFSLHSRWTGELKVKKNEKEGTKREDNKSKHLLVGRTLFKNNVTSFYKSMNRHD